MAETALDLKTFLARHPDCALVEVVEARGSTPREAGAWMLVAPTANFGTIGGGQLEWMAIDEARRVLASDGGNRGAHGRTSGETVLVPRLDIAAVSVARPSALPGISPTWGEISSFGLCDKPISPLVGEMPGRAEGGATGAMPAGSSCPTAILDIPLGPEIGQCCGGRVKLAVTHVDDALKDDLLSEASKADVTQPDVLLFGGGHVGHALAAALALLPVRTTVVETRGEALEGLAAGVGRRLEALPETAVREARLGSAFVVLTHDHALDFLLAAEALKREDAAYVGMIGSVTKRATFRRWFREEAGGTEAQFARLVCPIGGGVVRDKRPAVIAALAAAEILAALAGVGAVAAR